MVVVQLAERSLSISDDPGSKPAIGNFYWKYLLLTVDRTYKNKWKRGRKRPIFKKGCCNNLFLKIAQSGHTAVRPTIRYSKWDQLNQLNHHKKAFVKLPICPNTNLNKSFSCNLLYITRRRSAIGTCISRRVLLEIHGFFGHCIKIDLTEFTNVDLSWHKLTKNLNSDLRDMTLLCEQFVFI